MVFAFGLLLHWLFWHLPLDHLGALMTPTQDERYSDPNFYLYAALQVCQKAQWNVDDLLVTWSSMGVVGYLTLGCRLLHTEYFYILLNPALAALALGLCLHSAVRIGLQPQIGLASLFALPYTLLTISMPGKEVISVLGAMGVASGMLLLTSRRFRVAAVIHIVAGIILVALSRPHEAAALALFVLLWQTGSFRSPVRLVVLLALAAHAAPELLSYFQLSSAAETLTDESLWSGSSEGKTADYDSLFSLLRSDNIVAHAVLGAFRVAVVLLAPITSLFSPWTEAEPAYFIFRDLSQRLRIIDLGFIILVFVTVLRSVRPDCGAMVEARTRWMLPTFFLFMIYGIVFFGVSQKSRYTFQYTPLLLVWYWLYSHRIISAVQTADDSALVDVAVHPVAVRHS